VAEFELTSSAFQHLSLALVVDDPYAPSGTFTHWLAWGIDPTADGLGEREAAPGEGLNDFGQVGWRGPCRRQATGRTATSFGCTGRKVNWTCLSAPARRKLERALEGRALAVAELVGTYKR
jgi:phosphatidylethanolamine-binding protein (PEBP) family uncharacterized protein